MGCNFAGFLADLTGSQRQRTASHGCTATGVCAKSVWGGVGIAFFDQKILWVKPEFFGNNLRPCGLVSLPLGFRACADNPRAARVNADFCAVKHFDA